MKWLRFVVFAAALPLTAQNLTFEVASVKQSAPDLHGTGISTDRGGFKTENTRLVDLIGYAYDVQLYQISGGPAWVKEMGFDITAKNDLGEEAEIPETDRRNQEARRDRIRARVRQLLTERFQLQLREEKKELSVLALSVDKAGNKLKVADKPNNSMNVNRSNSAGTIHATGVTMRRLCATLGNILAQPVVDETSLDGVYDLDLKFTLDSSGKDSTDDIAGPPIYTSLREQLGLRLGGKKAMVTTWVIEKVEKPGEN